MKKKTENAACIIGGIVLMLAVAAICLGVTAVRADAAAPVSDNVQLPTQAEDATEAILEPAEPDHEGPFKELKLRITEAFAHPEEITKAAVRIWLHLIVFQTLFGCVGL